MVVTGLTLLLIAGSGTLVAFWLIRNRDGEPEDLYTVTLPQFRRRGDRSRRSGQPLAGVWIGEEPAAVATHIQEELPY
ncbi:MAG: hypothetical protein IT328_23370 [Caldilineaceae bacterium]|nr:hypothetical protein [Caldilineaceae bacterium]